MLVRRTFQKEGGYKVWTVGDDIAWIRRGEDGRLWALNPETGFFGVAPGTNSRTNPNALATIRRNTIFTNVLLTGDGDVWWENGEGEPPAEGIAWDGRPWKPGMVDNQAIIFTGLIPTPLHSPDNPVPQISPEWEGVPLTATVSAGGGHLAPRLMKPSTASRVYVGATMASEVTAAQYGKQGKAGSHGHASFLRLQHGRLFQLLA